MPTRAFARLTCRCRSARRSRRAARRLDTEPTISPSWSCARRRSSANSSPAPLDAAALLLRARSMRSRSMQRIEVASARGKDAGLFVAKPTARRMLRFELVDAGAGERRDRNFRSAAGDLARGSVREVDLVRDHHQPIDRQRLLRDELFHGSRSTRRRAPSSTRSASSISKRARRMPSRSIGSPAIRRPAVSITSNRNTVEVHRFRQRVARRTRRCR